MDAILFQASKTARGDNTRMAIAEAIDQILMIAPTEPCFIALGSIELPAVDAMHHGTECTRSA
jgi:hypothetical protein